MKNKYIFKSEYTKILKILRMSYTAKKKAGWSKEVSAGFIKEYLIDVKDLGKIGLNHTLSIETPFEIQKTAVNNLNLRETEELIDFVDAKVKTEKVGELFMARPNEKSSRKEILSHKPVQNFMSVWGWTIIKEKLLKEKDSIFNRFK